MFTLIAILALSIYSKAENRETIVPIGKNPNSNKDYFTNLKFQYSRALIGGSYYSIVIQETPIDDAPPFDIVSYSILENKELVDSPKFEAEYDGNLYLNVAFTPAQLTETYGCSTLADSSGKLVNCRLLLRYIDPCTENIYKEVEYVMIVRVSQKGESEVGTSPILQNGCDCILVEGLEVISVLYKDEACTEKVQADDVIEFGSRVCLEISSPSELIKDMYFTPTRLTMTYASSKGEELEMDILGLSEFSCGTPCKPAVAYSIFTLSSVGELKFNQVVKLEKGRRLDNNDYLDEPEVESTHKGLKSEYTTVQVDYKSFGALGRSMEFTLLIIMLIIL